MSQLRCDSYLLVRLHKSGSEGCLDSPTQIRWTAPSATAKRSRSAILPYHHPSKPRQDVHTNSQGTFLAASRSHDGWLCERSTIMARIETCSHPGLKVFAATGVPRSNNPGRGNRRSSVARKGRERRETVESNRDVIPIHAVRRTLGVENSRLGPSDRASDDDRGGAQCEGGWGSEGE